MSMSRISELLTELTDTQLLDFIYFATNISICMTSSARSLLALLPFLLLEQVLVVNLRQNVYSCANIY